MNSVKKTKGVTSEVLDQGVIEALRVLEVSGGKNILNRVVNLYLESSSELVELLQVACGANKAQDIEKLAHALKSSSHNVGAMNLGRSLSELEADAREQNIEDIEDRLAEILREYDLVILALRKELAQ